MRAIRRQYLEETARAKLQERAEKAEKLKREAEEKERRKKDIEEFRKVRAMGYEGNVSLTSPKTAKVVADALEEDAMGGNEVDLNRGNKNNAVEIKSYVEERRRVRFKTELARQAELSRARQESLLYLFHASSSFVTYANLDEKLSECFSGSSTSIPHKVSYSTLKTVAEKRLFDRGESRYSSEVGNTSAGYDSYLNSISRDNSDSHDNLGSINITKTTSNTGADGGIARYSALRDVVKGTIAGGRPGVESISRWMREVVEARDGGFEAAIKEREERVKKYRQDKELRLIKERELKEKEDAAMSETSDKNRLMAKSQPKKRPVARNSSTDALQTIFSITEKADAAAASSSSSSFSRGTRNK